MLEALGPYRAGEKLEDRAASRARRDSWAKNVKPHLPHEVLAEKILHRVGFCVGFLAEQRGFHATQTNCSYGGRYCSGRLRRSHRFWRRVRRLARHGENGNHAKQARRAQLVRRNL